MLQINNLPMIQCKKKGKKRKKEKKKKRKCYDRDETKQYYPLFYCSSYVTCKPQILEKNNN